MILLNNYWEFSTMSKRDKKAIKRGDVKKERTILRLIKRSTVQN